LKDFYTSLYIVLFEVFTAAIGDESILALAIECFEMMFNEQKQARLSLASDCLIENLIPFVSSLPSIVSPLSSSAFC